MSSGLVKRIRKYSQTEILNAMVVIGYRLKRYPGKTFNEDLCHVPQHILADIEHELGADLAKKIRKTEALLLDEPDFWTATDFYHSYFMGKISSGLIREALIYDEVSKVDSFQIFTHKEMAKPMK